MQLVVTNVMLSLHPDGMVPQVVKITLSLLYKTRTRGMYIASYNVKILNYATIIHV